MIHELGWVEDEKCSTQGVMNLCPEYAWYFEVMIWEMIDVLRR